MLTIKTMGVLQCSCTGYLVTQYYLPLDQTFPIIVVSLMSGGWLDELEHQQKSWQDAAQQQQKLEQYHQDRSYSYEVCV